MVVEYFFFFLFGLVVFLLTIIIPFFSTSIVFQENYQEKISSYECGFEPFEKYIKAFEVRYYLIAILFLLFDLEIIFLMPWILVLPYLSLAGLLSMLIFFFFLIISFYYEWLRGGLEWD